MATTGVAGGAGGAGAVRRFVARRATPLAAAVCAVSFASFLVAQRLAAVSMIDLMVYRAEGHAVRAGHDLYALVVTHAHLRSTYPPFAALLFEPLGWPPAPELRVLAAVGNLGLLLVVARLSLRLVGLPRRLPPAAATLATAAVAVWSEPVWTTLRYGQINLLIAALVLWDLTRRPENRWAGVGIGVAAGVKLTPALFAVFLAAVGLVRGWRALRAGRRPWNTALRQAAVAAGAFAGTVGLAAVLLPRDSSEFWTRMVFETSRVGQVQDAANQSLRGVLARALHTTGDAGGWLVLAALTGLLGLAVAVGVELAGDRLPGGPAWAACGCAVTGLLVSPISWSHHWVWCLPLVLLLTAEALRRGDLRWRVGAGVTALLFCSYLIWLVPHADERVELRQDAGQLLLSALYPLIGLAFLVLAAAQTLRALRTPPPPDGPADHPRPGTDSYAHVEG